MTTTTAVTSPSTSTPLHTPSRLAPLRLTFGGLVSGGWIKLMSQRSTYWTMALAAGAIVAMAATAGASGTSSSGMLSAATVGVSASQFAVMLLGIFVVTGEFRTGQIRSTFNADPRRTRVLAAKAVVVASTAFVVTVASLEAAVIVLLVPHFTIAGLWALVSVSAFLRIIGAGLAMAFIGVVSVAFAAALRRTGPAIVGVLVVLLVLPGITVILPKGVLGTVVSYLPASVASSLYAAPGGATGGAMMTFSSAPAVTPWVALVLVLAYSAVMWWGGMTILKRSDV